MKKVVFVCFALLCLGKITSARLARTTSGTSTLKATPDLKINERDYFEMRGLNIMVFSNWYNGLLSDSKMSGGCIPRIALPVWYASRSGYLYCFDGGRRIKDGGLWKRPCRPVRKGQFRIENKLT